MLIVEKPQKKSYAKYGSGELTALEKRYKVEATGKGFLRSIVESQSRHFYKGWWYLVFRLKMCDKIKSAALAVNHKMGFSTGGTDDRLDPVYWMRDATTGDFKCKGEDFAAAVTGMFSDSDRNRLECKGLSHVMALRALQLALGNVRFNKHLKKALGSKPLTVPLQPYGSILESELLTADPKSFAYKGDGVFRPGDLVAFGNSDRSVALRTQWRVENAVCVGWKAGAGGSPDFNEPLFVGGGVGQVLTEYEMREFIYKQTPDPRATGDRKAHFMEKAIGGPKCTHRLDSDAEEEGESLKGTVPNIYLNADVMRISTLGGRRDLG